jgi:hypothetical protein
LVLGVFYRLVTTYHAVNPVSLRHAGQNPTGAGCIFVVSGMGILQVID